MGNKFLALRKSEVAKAAPDRAGIHGGLGNRGTGRIFDWWVNIKGRRRFRNELYTLHQQSFG